MTTRSVSVRLDLETARAIAKSREFGAAMSSAMDQAEGSSRRTGAALDDIETKAGRLATGGVIALGSIAAAAVGWESAWAGVTKTVDGSAEEMQALEDGLRGLATTLPATHDEIAGVAEAAGQLGVAREDVVAFTATMVDLGETTNLTAEDAATSIAQISNVMGTAGEDVDNFGATLVALGNDGASTEKQILDMAQRIAGAGAQIGLTEADILAVANAAASMGIEAEAGGSAISRVFSDMAKVTAQGGDDLEKYAEVAGVSSQKFVRAFEQDPAQAFAMFTQGLDRIKESGGDVFTVLDELELSDIRVSQALLGMAASGDLLADSLELGSQAWEENTALVEEAEKRYATTAAQAQVAWNEIKDAGIEAGGALLPVIAEVADVVGNLASGFADLPGPVKSSLTGLIGITTVFSGALWFGAKTVGGVTSMRESLRTLGTTADGTKGKLGGVSSLLGGPWGLAVGGATIAVGLLLNEQGKAAGYVDDLTAALDDQTGAMTRNTIAQNLNDEGWLEYAKSIGLSAETVIDAALGSAAAMEQVRKAGEAADPGFWTLDMSHDAKQFVTNVEAQAKAQKEAEKNARLLAEANGETAASARDDAAAHDEMDAAYRRAASGITYTAEQIDAAQKLYSEQVEAAQDVAQSFFNLGDKVDKAKVSLGEWLKSLENQADALRNFRLNSIKAAKEGLDEGLIASLQDAGVSGALRMKQLANATDEEIERANRAWKRGKREIRLYVDATTDVPDELTTTVDVDTGKALRKVDALEARLQSMQYHDVFINIRETGSTTLGPRLENADGSVLDFYANGGMRENHVAQVAPAGSLRVWAEPETGGEAYIPLAPSKRSRSLDIWSEVGSRLGVQGFADGATVTGNLFRASQRSTPMHAGRSVLVGAAGSSAGVREGRTDQLLEQILDALDDSHETIGRGIARESGRGWSEQTRRTRAAGHGGFSR